MKQALEQARIALLTKNVPVGCILVRDNEIIARSYNRTDLSPIHHAELLAMADIDVSLGFDAYITVEPCAMCAAALAQTAVKTVFFGACNQKYGGQGGKVLNKFEKPWSQYQLVGNILEKECVELLQQFFAVPNEKFTKE